MSGLIIWIAIAGGILLLFVIIGLRIITEYEKGIVFRLGRYVGLKGAGLRWLIPFVEQMVKVDLRLIARDVPPQDVITRDNVSVKVNAVIYFRVMEPDKAILQVENFLYATSQLAQTTLRSVLGQVELDELLAERDKINDHLQEVLDQHTDPWGIKITLVEVKHIDLPQEMQRAMAKQAEAERERRAKVISAEGELQASEKLRDASKTMMEYPAAITLRYLQTLTEVAAENNSTTLFPIPMDLLQAFTKRMATPASEPARALPASAEPDRDDSAQPPEAPQP